ncbi:uncharacterized protein LOC116261230 [Nymphaea colorata]|nr:uncharacterized protein LOC116261230 [Nymphaea colorata]XP_031495750.1 uncharacterized protein LOC116261230 [Nymphaea colorata]XP_031495751.1 uncharacterized protein LOC116261230 [Nymphaea colorata]XP_031495752.1 uncharacterized protein LOC116261230 [Nymphaea colorata]XP_031495753.1 uncharacterized protein LOC116261230 [Nymphaea colorata]XP_031495754.1 uncharacterized protein LOC116261230 [Nymphaea colorata]XP_031495755.1 uncharacterized protein LOC116261230 [Nymphaea colorata]XP_03149575
MEEATTSSQGVANIFKLGTTHEEIIKRDGPQLVGLLKEMKEGLDTVRSKVQALMEKVKENIFPTREGISYLDVKYLLLLSYCQSIIYYSLLKAKGLSVSDHPVVRSLVESRLFLEKVRPIDKKLQYQVEKLMRAANSGSRMVAPDVKESEDKDNPLQYKPNPDMIVSKIDQAAQDGKGLYRPPMIAPTSMDEGHSSKHKRTELRKEKEAVRQASHSSFLKEMMNELEGKPEEVRTSGWHESRDFIREKAKLEERAHMEEENFVRVPYSKEEKKKIKQLKRARNGLLGLVDDFYHEVSGLLPAEAKESKKKKGGADVKGKKNFGKRKRMR